MLTNREKEKKMETFFQLIGGIFNGFTIFSKTITEEIIEENIAFLKQYDWFARFLENDSYQQLIFKNQDVRYIIGKLNQKKIKMDPTNPKYEQKIHQALVEARK